MEFTETSEIIRLGRKITPSTIDVEILVKRFSLAEKLNMIKLKARLIEKQEFITNGLHHSWSSNFVSDNLIRRTQQEYWLFYVGCRNNIPTVNDQYDDPGF